MSFDVRVITYHTSLAATYRTLQLLPKEEGVYDRLRTIQQAHLYLRTQVLADYHGDHSLFKSRKDLVKDLLTRALVEYGTGETWAWSSYTTAFALLRYTDAYDGFAQILAVSFDTYHYDRSIHCVAS